MSDPDVTRIHKRLDELSQTFSTEFGKLATAMSSIEATCVLCRAMIDRHDEALHGNGRNGIRQQVTGLSAVQESQADAIRSLRSTHRRAVWELVRFGVGVLLGVVVYAATMHLGG